VIRIIVKVPDPFGTCHYIEIIGLVAARDDDRMIATRHQNDIAIFDSHRFIDVSRVAVDALENKALRRIDSMVIGFLKQALYWDVVHVVFMRGIAG
jgi:hypothetical protein